MAQELMGKFYTVLNLPLQDKIRELTIIIDQSSPNKELQALYPQLISNILNSASFNTGWGLRAVTCDNNRHEFMSLLAFLEPQGPLFRLIYKLLSDPHLKYNMSLDALPQDLKFLLERGRCPQFYADMITMDSQAMNIISLALNPFDYYIFNFALHLVSNNQNTSSWENWNSAYFALACDYLMHFLPSDPNVPVLPLIPVYSGKAMMAAPLQTSNRPLGSPSLLLIPELSPAPLAPAPEPRHEVWRSETVLQLLVDVWMSNEETLRGNEVYKKSSPSPPSHPERVRLVRVLVKHLHAYSARHAADPAARSAALRQYARQLASARAHHYVRHLVATWPLDASFRLVMELWFSLIQPWRYTDAGVDRDGGGGGGEEAGALDGSGRHTQHVAETFPTYQAVFRLLLPRFMRLDLTHYKNAVMLFRLGKVFSQPHLISILKELEQGIANTTNGMYYNPDISWNNNSFDASYSTSGANQTSRWVSAARQAVSELGGAELSGAELSGAGLGGAELSGAGWGGAGWGGAGPVWAPSAAAVAFVQRVASARAAAARHLDECQRRLEAENKGAWAAVKNWLMIGDNEDRVVLEECKKVPVYLESAVQQFTYIFGLNESTIVPESAAQEDASDHSSFGNSSAFPLSITQRLRSRPADVRYSGDPDLVPIATYESVILVRMLHQLASRINDLYGPQLSRLWHRGDFWGSVAREVLQAPCAVRGAPARPPRLSLRRLGSHAAAVWLGAGYAAARLASCGAAAYCAVLLLAWAALVLLKAAVKSVKAYA